MTTKESPEGWAAVAFVKVVGADPTLGSRLGEQHGEVTAPVCRRAR
jgi:hypothetical protein